MINHSQKPFKNKLLLAFVIISIIAGAGYFIFTRYISSKDVSGKIQSELIKMVSRKSGGLYQLSIGSLTIQGETGNAIFRDLSLSVDSQVLNSRISQKNQP